MSSSSKLAIDSKHFESIELIARGGTSLIFRAYQPSLERFVVIKRLKEEFLTNPQMRERFRREAKALATVLHQNVAHVYDFHESETMPYLVMEYIDGVDLSDALKKVGNLNPEIAAIIALHVARGLTSLHDNGFIHRDVKPANIRVTSRGGVKLMDLGIALGVSQESLTNPEILVGSPHYLSPEQILGEKLKANSDLFSLGICLYEMLSGSRPFRGDGQKNVFQQIREAKYTGLRELNSLVPKDLERIVIECLEADPQKRIKTADRLVVKLESFLGPKKVLYADSIISQFLEDEALVSISFKKRMEEVEERKSQAKIHWKPFVAGLAISVALFLAFWIFSSGSRKSLETVPVSPYRR